MAPISMLFGLLLIALGLVGYLSPTTLGELGPKGTSPTALIPTGFGALLLLCGIVVHFNPMLRKRFMHGAVVVALIGAVGGVMPLRSNNFDMTMAGAVSGLLMIVLCLLFVLLCIRSFARARFARSEGLPENPRTE